MDFNGNITGLDNRIFKIPNSDNYEVRQHIKTSPYYYYDSNESDIRKLKLQIETINNRKRYTLSYQGYEGKHILEIFGKN